jgi:hypothetical protein
VDLLFKLTWSEADTWRVIVPRLASVLLLATRLKWRLMKKDSLLTRSAFSSFSFAMTWVVCLLLFPFSGDGTGGGFYTMQLL